MEWGKLAAKSITVSTANVQQQEHSHLHLVSAVAMAKLQFLAALACAAVAEACNKNSDCASNWCDGGTFFSSGRCKPRRADGERAVGSWPSYDYNICLAGRGKCGICGDRVPDGSACTANSDCVSDWCEGFGSCSGVCKGRKADGTRIVCDSLSITTGGCDYNQCVARAGKCGVCGRTVPDGSTCSENADCSSGWCEGFPSVGCQGSCRPKKDDGYRLPCNDPTKVTSGGCDYNQCKASEGRCGVCGRKVPTGTSCSQESDCASNVCRLPAGVLGTSVGCNGQCAEPLPDGSMLPRLTWPINGAFYDYSECSAGAGICGVCGSRAGEGAKCSATADCAEDLCCGGLLEGRISVNCQGTCVKRTPSACPSLVDMSALTEVVDSFVKFARDFGQCMIEEVVEPWLEARKLSEDTVFPSRAWQPPLQTDIFNLLPFLSIISLFCPLLFRHTSSSSAFCLCVSLSLCMPCGGIMPDHRHTPVSASAQPSRPQSQQKLWVGVCFEGHKSSEPAETLGRSMLRRS